MEVRNLKRIFFFLNMYLVSYVIFGNAKSRNWLNCYQGRMYIVQSTFCIEVKYMENMLYELTNNYLL